MSVFAMLTSLCPADPARAADAPTRGGPRRLSVVPAITVSPALPAPPPPPPPDPPLLLLLLARLLLLLLPLLLLLLLLLLLSLIHI